MRAIAPRTGAPEIMIAENQTEYLTLPAAAYVTKSGVACLLTRWRFTDEERERIAGGEDLFLMQLTFGQPMQPIELQVGPEGYTVSEDS
jgi:hypothetical protein